MSEHQKTNEWHIFKGDGREPHTDIDEKLPPAPRWRTFTGKISDVYNPPAPLKKDDDEAYRGVKYRAAAEEVEMVNAALYLRRPLLVTGPPGAGKSTLAHAVAYELSLGPVLHWPVTTRSTIQDGLYSYDAIGRLQETQGGGKDDPGRYIRLGPLGTAMLPTKRPRALLIDEIDKSDIDLPNDLLNVFEEGRFPIQELVRRGEDFSTGVYPWKGNKADVSVTGGEVVCAAFPFVVLTSNGERELPPPFLRRCIRLDIPEPDEDKLADIVRSHFDEALAEGERKELIKLFLGRRKDPGSLATDQLLNAVYLTLNGAEFREGQTLIDAVLRRLNDAARP